MSCQAGSLILHGTPIYTQFTHVCLNLLLDCIMVNCYFAVTIHADQAIKKGLLTTSAPVLAQLLSLLQVLENMEKA